MKKVKILIVEDDLMTLQGYVAAFSQAGFFVFQAQDGLEGLKVATREKPDIILSDIMMPIMDGIDMLKKMREGNDYEKNVPVVLLTNLNPGAAKIDEKVPETGPVYYVLKADFTFRQIVDKVKEILSQSK